MNTLPNNKQSLLALDMLNMFMMNIHQGIRPYLVVYLASALYWDSAQIGTLMSITGIIGVMAQLPAGAIIDITPHKRLLIIISALIIGACSFTTVLIPDFIFINITQSLAAMAGALFAPAVSAISLGIVGRKKIERQIGRNQTFTAAGNVVVALLIGVLTLYFSVQWIYYTIALLSIVVAIIVLFIREKDIDHIQARGIDHGFNFDSSNNSSKMLNKTSIVFIISIVLFHFANASMLPLLGQLLAMENSNQAPLYLSACIITAQLVIVPLGLYIGKCTEKFRRRPLLLIAFIVLPIRGFLYTLNDLPAYLISIQVLDAIGAVITGIMQIVISADLTRNNGKFNFMQGIIAAAVGIGTSLSIFCIGYIVEWYGFNTGFIFLSAIALVALGFFYFLMPETKSANHKKMNPQYSL